MTDNARFWIAILIAPLLVSAAVVLVNAVFVIFAGASFPALASLILVALPILYVATLLGWLPAALLIHQHAKRKRVASVVGAGLFWVLVGLGSIFTTDTAFGEGHPAFLFLCLIAGLFAGLGHSMITYTPVRGR